MLTSLDYLGKLVSNSKIKPSETNPKKREIPKNVWEGIVSLLRIVFALLLHLKHYHYNFAGERPYKCELCPYSSSQKTHLTRHMRTHSGWYEMITSISVSYHLYLLHCFKLLY